MVNGANFLPSSVVQWNGTNRTTTFVSGTQLSSTIPASDIPVAGTAQVTVFNPAPGGGASSALVFSINAAGVVERLSVATDGTEGNGDSFWPYTSPDGRFVAFESLASNLVPGDTNAAHDTFIRNTCRGAPTACTPSTIRASVANDGSQANGESFWPLMSADGRFLAFRSSATNLVPGDTNGTDDIFLRDTCLGAGSAARPPPSACQSPTTARRPTAQVTSLGSALTAGSLPLRLTPAT